MNETEVSSETADHSDKGEETMQSDIQSTGVFAEIKQQHPELPDDAIVWFYLKYEATKEFLNELSIDWLYETVEAPSFIYNSNIDGCFTLTHTRQSVRTNECNGVFIPPGMFTVEYYNILTDKQEVARIIGTDVTEDEIENVIIIELWDLRTSRPPLDAGNVSYQPYYAYIGVQTAKGDYYLEDNVYYDEDKNELIYDWIVYTPEEFKQRISPIVYGG